MCVSACVRVCVRVRVYVYVCSLACVPLCVCDCVLVLCDVNVYIGGIDDQCVAGIYLFLGGGKVSNESQEIWIRTTCKQHRNAHTHTHMHANALLWPEEIQLACI